MKIYILAVTKAFDKYCIAGMTENGAWVRPIPQSEDTRFWRENEITFNQGKGFIRVGDVIEFDGVKPSNYQHANHTEDIIVVSEGITFVDRLNAQQLSSFLTGKNESQKVFDDTVHACGRSLCLVKVDAVQFKTTQYQEEPKKPKMTFTNEAFDVSNPKTNLGDYIVKDCKWSNIVLKNTHNNHQSFSDIYVAIGLATPTGYDGIEYPQVIGFHTNQQVPLPTDYPN